MDFLKAEIGRKKRQLEANNLIAPDKKFFRREELINKWDEEYKRKESERDKDADSAQKSNSEKSKESSSNDTYVLPRKEVIKRLRERSEPIILFGESELDAFQRLKKLEILEPEINRGFRNDFQEALEKVDQAYMNEILQTQGKEETGGSANDVKVTYEETTIDDILKMSVGLGGGDVTTNCKVIVSFLKLLLQMWGHQLNSRTEPDKESVRGKLDSATYAQTQAYLKPLIRKLKTKSLQEDILDSLVEIVRHMLDREYVKASDSYLQMAIGNAPWPIGVTMVGIHARTGREKIFSKHVAHVLNDETQRKYIQALKRLMTKCQQFFPTTPSKSVEYNAA